MKYILNNSLHINLFNSAHSVRMNIAVSDGVSIADTVPVEQSVQDVLEEANLNCSKEK